jgi:large subunit ribosomal protein L10
VPKQAKVELVSELKERISASDALLLTEYRGLSVSDIMSLRRSLAEAGTGFAVVKNTLMRRAAKESGMDELDEMLAGPSAVAFVSGDPVSAAKKVVEASKKYPTLVLKGGYLDGKVLSAEDAKALAELEPREVMLSKIAGLLKGEMSRAAALFVGAPSKFLSLLEAYRDKITPEGGEAVAEEAVAEEAVAEEAVAEEAVAEEAVAEEAVAEEAVAEEAPVEASEATAAEEAPAEETPEETTTETPEETSGSEEGE